MSAAVSLPVLIGIFGVATDYANLFLIRTELQSAVDGAVVFAAKQYGLAGTNDDNIKAVVRGYLDEQLLNKPQLKGFEFSMANDAKDGTVSVNLSLAWTPFFAHFFDAGATPVHVNSTARYIGSQSLCVLTLDPGNAQTILLDMRARLKANGCSVYADSRNAVAIRLNLDSSISAGSICAVGGAMAKVGVVTPEPVTDCPVVPDPLAERAAPDVKGCDETNLVVANEVRTLSPGVFCGGLTISGTSQVTLEPGLYVMQEGPFSVRDDAVVTGANVGFYMSGSFALINLKGGKEIRLSGMEEGTMAGLLFFEDRTAVLGRKHVITSPGVREMTGTIYLPKGKLFINPNAKVAEQSAYTAIVSYQLELTEGPELVLNSDYEATKVPVPDGIKASSQVVLTK